MTGDVFDLEAKDSTPERLLEVGGDVLALLLACTAASVDAAEGDSEIVGNGGLDGYPERERKLISNLNLLAF
jgi:hypothetical protein